MFCVMASTRWGTLGKFVLLVTFLVGPLHCQTDEDDQFKEEMFNQIKQLTSKLNLLEQRLDQLASQLKAANEKIASLEAERGKPGAKPNPVPTAGTGNLKTNPTPSASQCPADISPSAPCTFVDKFGCYCIFSSRNAKTYSAAKKHCNDQKMELVAIETPEEQLILNGLLKLKTHDWPFWTSGSDEEIEGFWKWTSTDRPVNYTNWQESQPDNEGNIQHVLMIMKNEPFKWFDGMKRQNGQELGANFICELTAN